MSEQKHDRMLARAAARGAARGHGSAKTERPAPKAKGAERGAKGHGRDVAAAQQAVRDARKGSSPK